MPSTCYMRERTCRPTSVRRRCEKLTPNHEPADLYGRNAGVVELEGAASKPSTTDWWPLIVGRDIIVVQLLAHYHTLSMHFSITRRRGIEHFIHRSFAAERAIAAASRAFP